MSEQCTTQMWQNMEQPRCSLLLRGFYHRPWQWLLLGCGPSQIFNSLLPKSFTSHWQSCQVGNIPFHEQHFFLIWILIFQINSCTAPLLPALQPVESDVLSRLATTLSRVHRNFQGGRHLPYTLSASLRLAFLLYSGNAIANTMSSFGAAALCCISWSCAIPRNCKAPILFLIRYTKSSMSNISTRPFVLHIIILSLS